ncbi:hypothetical protein CVN76_01705 [Bacillus sp. mrc49]|nr:hypothetical protein CVN76_01705 [Bacillus sp. mrc49]
MNASYFFRVKEGIRSYPGLNDIDQFLKKGIRRAASFYESYAPPSNILISFNQEIKQGRAPLFN